MDTAAQLTSMASTEVLKEPRGFIKFIQIGLAIFAFATATAYYGSTSYTIKCSEKTVQTTISFGYPFKLDGNELEQCVNGSTLHAYGDYTSSSQFYVFVGVTAFLYSLGMLIFYVFADHLYQNLDMVPVVTYMPSTQLLEVGDATVGRTSKSVQPFWRWVFTKHLVTMLTSNINDFIVTAVYVLLWLISSSAWADAVSKIKHYANPLTYYKKEFLCECMEYPTCLLGATCHVSDEGNFATINVSIIFGFLCMCVWAGNLWFLYKDTKWFKASRDDQMTKSQPSTPGSLPQQI